ncbi:MAG: helix-turn-helix domain-containing protein, partial [Chromatiales bacterium]|nr:helix-turn-helix domain-containing protein [Chromatiales bacterium]
CNTFRCGNMHLVHEHQNRLIHKTGFLPKNTCTVSMFLSQDPARRFSHFHSPDTSQIFLLPEENELDIQVPGDTDTLYVCLEQDRLMDGISILNERVREQTPRQLHAYDTIDTGSLAADMLALLDPPPRTDDRPDDLSSARVETLLFDTILLTLNKATSVHAGDTPEYRARRRANQRVKVAREFIDACLQADRLPSIVDICAQTGTSVRSLEYAFREVMQLTPAAYLRIHRLNKVRSELRSALTADTTITRVATNWGFVHLGEFARDYRRLFGERPSDTLARSLARHQIG